MGEIIYGIHPVKEALQSPHPSVERILIGTKKSHPLLRAILDLAREKNVLIRDVDRKTLDRLAKGRPHQNVLAVITTFPYADIQEILSSRKMETNTLLLILDGIQDPQNFGSIIRTSLGSGVQGILIPRDRAVGITSTVVKTSAGAAAHLPIARVVNIATSIDLLKQEGIWIYGATGEAENPLYDLDFTVHLAVVLGAEGKGIRPLVRKKCDQLFSIPMMGPISSFNVSVAGGIILYEIMRQRWTRKGKT